MKWSTFFGFPGGSEGKASACNVGDLGQGQEDPPEKEMATHSSTFALTIPWTEEPGRLSPWVASPWGCMGSAFLERLI